MIRLSPECHPCFLRQGVLAARARFETLAGRARNAVLIPRCEWPVVSRVLGRREGETIVPDGGAVP